MDKKEALLASLKAFGKEFESNLKSLVPVRKKGYQPPKYGALKDSIKTFADIKGETVESGVKMLYYGQFVNSGTYKMAAQPFINDAWAETRFNAKTDKALEQYLDSQFERAFNKL